MIIRNNDRVVFFGDSITHWYGSDDELGLGFCGMTGRALMRVPKTSEVQVFNRGISGNRISDIRNRLDSDVLSLNPIWVSLLLGINDVSGNKGNGTPLRSFESDYRFVLDKLLGQGIGLIISSPFLCGEGLLGGKDVQDFWDKHRIVCNLAHEYNCLYLDLNKGINEIAAKIGPELLTKDGVHPTQMGAGLIADMWWKLIGGNEL